MRRAIATVAETRTLEAELIRDWGVPELTLMERAALAVALQVRALADPEAPVVVLAGHGNNGADGLAAARLLKGWGYDPIVFGLEGKGTPSHAQQLAWARRWGVRLAPFASDVALPGKGVIVDALFGFGLDRAPAGVAARAIQAIHDAGARAVVAVDLPSGLDGTTGMAFGAVVHATHTVAAGVLKSGLLADPALEAVGRLSLGEIGFAPELLARLPGDVIAPMPLPRRRQAAHKGEAGSLLVVGGSAAMSGAPGLVARAAGRVGAGLVYLAVPEGIRDAVAVQMPEAVVFGLPSDPSGGLAASGWDILTSLLGRCRAVVLGPGLGRGPEAYALAERLYRAFEGPMVVDADALQPELLGLKAAGPRILTPHPGEAGRCLSVPSATVQADRLLHARMLSERSGAITVLKGARSVVADPKGRYGINVHGTPAMATAGSGDVLAGLLGGLLAQGCDPLVAARQATLLHGLAGGVASANGARHAVLASDLVEASTEAMALLDRKVLAPPCLEEVGSHAWNRDPCWETAPK